MQPTGDVVVARRGLRAGMVRDLGVAGLADDLHGGHELAGRLVEPEA
jgi:hypothetical protein